MHSADSTPVKKPENVTSSLTAQPEEVIGHYTLLHSLWEGYKFLIATVVYLFPLLSGTKKHGYIKQLIQYGLTL